MDWTKQAQVHDKHERDLKIIWKQEDGLDAKQAHNKHELHLKNLAQRRNTIAEIVWGFAKQFEEKDDWTKASASAR
ncbi:hypothetical protein FQR65_LT13913 [Abscondita terminalis]|nr:hypothetical protein FQR65_LT13913 [Abscondita terminalis]